MESGSEAEYLLEVTAFDNHPDPLTDKLPEQAKYSL